MHPLLLFSLAIFTPFILALTLLAPVYLGVLGATLVIYWPTSGSHPLLPRLADPFYIIDVYGKLFAYWQQQEALDFVHYTLPVIGLPVAGLVLALYLTYRLSGTLMNIFRLSSS